MLDKHLVASIGNSALIAWCALLPATGRAFAQRHDQHLILEEQAAVRLPHGYRASSAHASAQGVLVWAADDSVLYHLDQNLTLIRQFLLPDGILATAAALLPNGDVEVLSANARGVYRISGVRQQLVFSIGDTLSVVAAARVNHGWVFLAEDLLGTRRLLRQSGTSYQQVSEAAETALQYATLAARGNIVAITSVSRPFTSLLLDVTGGKQQVLSPAFSESHIGHDPVTASAAASSTPLLFSLPAVIGDFGVLQTITDLRSDRRWLALYDVSGLLLRTTELRVPLGFGSSFGSCLYAFRSIDGLEIVLYRWRSTPTPEAGNEDRADESVRKGRAGMRSGSCSAGDA